MSLDAKFGQLIPAQRVKSINPSTYKEEFSDAFKEWEWDNVPVSLTKLDVDSAFLLKQAIENIAAGWGLGRVLFYNAVIIWLVDKDGDIWFALEELVVNGKPTGHPLLKELFPPNTTQKLGHPALNSCADSRIGGEIYYDAKSTSPFWVINNKSGRYGRHKTRTEAHLKNVATKFKSHGISVEVYFYPEKSEREER